MRYSSSFTQLRKFFSTLVLLILLAAACHLSLSQAAPVLQPGLAPTPPMGWASWNHFFCEYTDQTIRDQADALVTSGMRDLGYRYVLIQECIAPGRNADGSLIVDAMRFPHGMKELVEYIHSRGLKAGIYTDIGVNTCFSNPLYEGSYMHEDQDASTFAAWGMDLVEMDYCNRPAGVTGREIYERMAAAIQKTGRPMLFYLCSWGNESPWTWAQGKAQLWRTDGDISGDKNHVQWAKVVSNFESNAKHSAFSAPDSWNDPDMLEVGNPGLTPIEAQSHFSMWAISAAPLWAGNDLTDMSDSVRRIYANSEVIAVDQDPLGAGASKVREYGNGIEVWMKPLGAIGSGVDAVLLLNLTAGPAEAAIQWSVLGLKGKAAVRDLWAHTDLGEFHNGFQTQIPSHGSVLLKVSGKYAWTKGATYEAEWPGNIRAGKAALVSCPDCSQGYAVSLRRADNGHEGSSLAFSHIIAPKSGRYWMNLVFTASGSAEQTVQMRVNEGQPEDISLQENRHGPARIRVELHEGDNSIAFLFAGEGSVDIDRLVLCR
jgi:alpha-galactosidase